ncbi:hypothetical protein [Duganella aceris]|uniref:Chitin-binding type-3 domain-containing protein n=1 Tax=Duganella aceris TaxID=2703883 RepID=A0ABX0FPW3_9BURK|nr:hypothetical protein [Duganella aceris]NGZ86404.1 hypothetical protein [Duganella aceris]
MSGILYTCAGDELPGDAELINADGVHFTTIVASRCHAEWYCTSNGYTWRWREGIDPEDPTTWPAPPEDPQPEPEPAK